MVHAITVVALFVCIVIAQILLACYTHVKCVWRFKASTKIVAAPDHGGSSCVCLPSCRLRITCAVVCRVLATWFAGIVSLASSVDFFFSFRWFVFQQCRNPRFPHARRRRKHVQQNVFVKPPELWICSSRNTVAPCFGLFRPCSGIPVVRSLFSTCSRLDVRDSGKIFRADLPSKMSLGPMFVLFVISSD